jgi:parallel beta-helix repeat protein
MLTSGDKRRPGRETGEPFGGRSSAGGGEAITRKRSVTAAVLALLPLLTASCVGSTGGPPWSLEGAPLPNDENSIQRTIHRMSTVSTKYDLTFLPGDREPPSLFALRPLGLEVYRVDADGHLGVGRESSEWGDEWKVASIPVPMTARGGLPGDAALEFLGDFTERVQAGGGRVDAQNLEPEADVVWVATEMAGTHGFVWGAPASPWVFESAADTQADLANLVRAFAEVARAANRDRAFSRSADLAGSTLLVTSDTTLRDDHQGSVEVEADDVTLDCAGYTISGPGTRAEDEYGFIGILLDGRTGVTVRNCRVSGFDYGTLLTARLGSGSDGNRILDNVALGNRLDGVRVNESEHNVLTGNIASSNGQNGFALLGNSNIVTGNRAFNNDGDGFAVGGGHRDIVFSANISKGNRAHGFGILGTGHTFVRNEASENGLVGFSVGGLGSEGITFKGNTAIGNGIHGFQVIDSRSNTFVRNTASGNRAVGFSLELGARENALYRNIARGNGEDGFRTMQESIGNTFERNVALDNGWTGFREEAGPNSFENNRACKNGDTDALDVGSDSRWRNNAFCAPWGR